MTIHPLKTLDSDKFLPQKKELHYECGCINCRMGNGYNTRCQEEDSIGMEPVVEEIYKTIGKAQLHCHSGIIDPNKLIAQAIANNPKCFKLVKLED